MNADLFFRFNPMPGNLNVVQRIGIYTLTQCHRAGCFTLWRYNTPVARGSRETCRKAQPKVA